MTLLARRLRPDETMAAALLVGAAVAPHAAHLSPWVSGLFGALAAMRLAVGKHAGRIQGRLILLGLTALGVAAVASSSPILIGRDGGVALLVVMLGLKLVEMRTRRDLVVLALLGYFVVITQFLYSRSMGLAVYCGLVVWALTALLTASQRAGAAYPRARDLGYAGLILLQAVPVMLVLFLVFPRLQGPLWSFGTDDSVALIGLSDRLEPGSISRLATSTAVAMRVEIEGVPPPPSQRYFRGPVFWSTDGKSWFGTPESAAQGEIAPGKLAIHQRITLEPTGQRWLLALDRPRMSPRAGHLTADGQILADAPVENELTYEVVSTVGPTDEPLAGKQRRLALQVPAAVSARVRALAESWRRAASRPREVVQRALRYFRTEPFVYTLSPPRLGDHPIDDFLFKTRRGFCEHFATSFTVLMRLAGVPARVVAGYQGGELNPRGGYLVVRQSDAHAWSEVWLQGEGWVRVDPTAAVAPQRIESPIDSAASARAGAVKFGALGGGVLQSLVRQVAWGLDALELHWHYWIVGYSRARQNQMLDILGLGALRGQWQAIGAVLMALAVIGLTGLVLRGRAGEPADLVRDLYTRFCRKLANAGLARAPCEGPQDFGRRSAALRPDLASEIRAITALYVDLRYGRGGGVQLRRLRRCVRGFRARRAVVD